MIDVVTVLVWLLALLAGWTARSIQEKLAHRHHDRRR